MGMKHTDQRRIYEPARFDSIEKHLSRGMKVYDIGAYDGITSVLLANIVGPSNVVIVEPAESNWGTIAAYWLAHFQEPPHATFAGFVDEFDRPTIQPYRLVYTRTFPPESKKFPLSEYEEHSKFQSLKEVGSRPFMTLTTLTAVVGTPVALNIDVEGAEGRVLRGAKDLLRAFKPLAWVSIHPKLMWENFGEEASPLFIYMFSLGYKATLLYEDHEQHWLFE